jgi:inosine-uridine nucleoside N-ribohydrolase
MIGAHRHIPVIARLPRRGADWRYALRGITWRWVATNADGRGLGGWVGEANIAGDPDAADSVFTAPWKVTMVGLDVTTRVRLDEAVLARVKARNARFGPFLYAISRFYEAFHQKEVTGGFYVHDPSAVVFLIQPDLFETKRGPMRVVRDGIAIGQTIMAAYDYQFELPPWKGQPLVTATVRVDAERFQRTVERLLVGDPR